MSNIANRGTGTLASYTTTGAAKNIVIPGVVVAGDLLLIGMAYGTSGSPTTPSGWTVVSGSTGTMGTNGGSIFYRIAQIGDAGATVTFPQTTGTRAILTCVAYSGVDQSSPFDAIDKDDETVSGYQHDSGTVSITTEAWVVRHLFVKGGTIAGAQYVEPINQVLRQSQPDNVFTSANQSGMAVSDSNSDRTGSAGPGTWTVHDASAGNTAVTAQSFGVAIALKPAVTQTTVFPTSDITTTGLTIVPTGSAFTVLADSDPATYVEVATGATRVLEVKFGTFSAAPNTITVKYLTAGSAATNSLNVKLMMGATMIADFGTFTGVPTSETIVGGGPLALTSGQKAACTNLSDLRVRITDTVT